MRGAFAIEMLYRWGLVMGAEDGEDSAGRMKTNPMPPMEVVIRACEIATCAYAEFKSKGWIVTVEEKQRDE